MGTINYLQLLTVFSDLWLDEMRFPKLPLQKPLTSICQQNETGILNLALSDFCSGNNCKLVNI